MPVELQFLNEKGEEININTGLDFGMSRKGVANISKFKIKNIGDITARDMLITAGTLNDVGEVTEEEYQNQMKATRWKTFSLNEDYGYTKQLTLGTVPPNKFVEGSKTTDVPFTNADVCPFKEDWSMGITEFRGGTHIFKKLDDEPKGQIAKRMNFPSMPSCRDFEIEFKIDFRFTTVDQSKSLPFIGFPVRINSKGNGMGYMFIMHYRRDDNKFMVSVYKNAKGMVTNMDRDYGTKIFDTITYQAFDKNKTIAFKVYNNSKGEPTFEVKYDGKNMILGKAFASGVQGTAMSDTASDAYTTQGAFYKDISLYDGDISCTMRDMVIKSEELEQFVYVKTLLGDDAENKIEYKSSAVLSYIED